MKLLQILNELRRIDNKDVLDDAVKNKKKITVIWDNGILSTDIKTHMSFNNIYLRVNFDKNEIKFQPMDDRSDLRFVKRVQQAVSDLKRSGYINDYWWIILGYDFKASKSSFGGVKVGTFLKYNANYDVTIPICFHGTCSEYLDSIEKYGIAPRDSMDSINYIPPNFDRYYSKDSSKNVYLTMDYNVAEEYAKNAAANTGSDPIVIRLEDIPIENVTADDDLINNVGYANLILKLSGQENKYNSYISGIRANSQFAYKGRIPKKYISKIEWIGDE